ncbi:MAG: hypothetical protein EBV89_12775, partial [Betaproteobacteria bacterium]|nr:hypothetical protein [Betaproteobacteria bacterium]
SPTGGRHPLPDPEQLVQAMRDLGANNDSLVVAYDAGPGVYAARLWWLLRWCGHPAVCVLDGGYAAWTQAGFPTEAGLAQAPGSRPQGNFSRRPALEVTVSRTSKGLSADERGFMRHGVAPAVGGEEIRESAACRLPSGFDRDPPG